MPYIKKYLISLKKSQKDLHPSLSKVSVSFRCGSNFYILKVKSIPKIKSLKLGGVVLIKYADGGADRVFSR